MEYPIVLIALLLCIQLYFAIAKKYNIVDKPNERSSHTRITLRGGGMIFPIAYLLFMGYEVLFNHYAFYLDNAPIPNFWLFGLGLLLICAVSFIDDIIDLSSKIRLIFHFISVTLLLYFLNAFKLLPFWAIPMCYILIIGILNAYNFMDGINGISGLYSVVLLGSLWFVNQYLVEFVTPDFIIYPIMAAVVFLYFNFRKRARCFLGDIGSMGIAFWILALLGLLIIKTGELKYLLFLTVYGIDVISTIAERLRLKEDIFKPHRRHLYQLFANEQQVDHRLISFAYALLQVVICGIIIKEDRLGLWLFPLIALPLMVLYLILKYRLKNTSTM
ncbi:MraY family glycosyltransferase [Chryseobacterium salivictor]|uniref:Putative undecaprenyl-phosphate N-acetylglucosaminyl 1-phosphate transferase n=1 Tax=Chryseobacterium salivictor TaxID=2547600 RepID=A0A4P6ZII2_9FLAO|nr:glycosyltransferase family 4 protein [Chryseobacterium salivictor]QBO59686.1 putative undecaprenyl-phosphate N-acetylglucosaminyl 1-phosphate transferase [Chryseobacterium salivictor]